MPLCRVNAFESLNSLTPSIATGGVLEAQDLMPRAGFEPRSLKEDSGTLNPGPRQVVKQEPDDQEKLGFHAPRGLESPDSNPIGQPTS